MDQLERITATKLTHNQKRGYTPGKASNHEFHNDRRAVESTAPRPPAQLRNAQLVLAEIALEADDPTAWLTEVLVALDLCYVVSVEPLAERTDCGRFRGTKRGYNIHLRSYTRVCEDCAVFRPEEAWTTRHN
jgi:hypothetical protein